MRILFLAFLVQNPVSEIQAWQGEFKGKLEIHNAQSAHMPEVEVTLSIKTTEQPDIWDFNFSYKSERYGLVHQKSKLEKIEGNKFQIKYEEGATLNATLLGGKLYYCYQEGPNVFSVSIYKSGDELHYEQVISHENEESDGETQSLLTSMVQRTQLKKA